MSREKNQQHNFPSNDKNTDFYIISFNFSHKHNCPYFVTFCPHVIPFFLWPLQYKSPILSILVYQKNRLSISRFFFFQQYNSHNLGNTNNMHTISWMHLSQNFGLFLCCNMYIYLSGFY